jgi:predicted nucleic-acid-binding Zn-ribbon protein
MSQDHVTDVKTCPKCSDRMNLMENVWAVPKYIGGPARSVSDTSPAISLSDVLTFEMYFCPNCRFVEFYGA